MENIILVCAAGLALIVCLVATFAAAHKSVNKTPNIGKQYNVKEGEIPIDDAVKYLKLTNLD